MANSTGGSSFIENLPKIYGMYTGGFLVFVLLMAILEQMGVGADTIGILFVAFTIVIYAGIGVLSRTMAVDAYYVAGRQVPAVFAALRGTSGNSFEISAKFSRWKSVLGCPTSSAQAKWVICNVGFKCESR